MAEINDLTIIDDNNTARFPEGLASGQYNNNARALEGILARWHKDTNASKASTGSANAYAFAADQTLAAYYDGLVIAFDANFGNTGAATLNVDSLGAKTIKKWHDQDLASGDIETGQKVWVVYDGTNFQLISPVANAPGGLGNVVEDTTPQLGAQLDVNGFALGDGTLELLSFVETGAAINHVQITNAAAGNGPLIDAAGDDTNVPLRVRGKGTGKVQLGDADLQWPDADGAAGEFLKTDGAGALAFAAGSGPSQATQAAIEAETNEDTYIPPDLLKHSPGVAKGWAQFDRTGAVDASYNVTSVTDNGTGDWTVNWATDFSSATYAAVAIWRDAGGSPLVNQLTIGPSQTAGVLQVRMSDNVPALVDPDVADDMHVVAFGDHA